MTAKLKIAEVIDKFETLKKEGKLDSYMARKRKKKASQGKKYIPK